jgi:ABC-2 type transport system ATP-binding protein
MTAARDSHPHAGRGLTARGVTHSFGGQRVLRGVDLQVAPGEVVALLGPNGAGKTTLMSTLVGLIEPDGGSVDIAPGLVGWVPQGRSTYARLTVRENLELFARLMRVPGKARDVAERAAHEADLEPWLGHYGWQLSGGLRQRLNTAMGLLGDPPVVILDEPTTGVDLLHRTALWHVVRRRADQGRAVLYSTHSLEDAAIADRVVVLVGGCMVWTGPLADLARLAPAGSTVEPVAAGLLALWTADTDAGAGGRG